MPGGKLPVWKGRGRQVNEGVGEVFLWDFWCSILPPAPLPMPVTLNVPQDDCSTFPQTLGFEGCMGVLEA